MGRIFEASKISKQVVIAREKPATERDFPEFCQAGQVWREF
jgi:hypothetical protein